MARWASLSGHHQTERDVLRMLAAEHSPLAVEDVMSSSLRVTRARPARLSRHKRNMRVPQQTTPTVPSPASSAPPRGQRRRALRDRDRDRHHAGTSGAREVFGRITTGNIAEVMDLPVADSSWRQPHNHDARIYTGQRGPPKRCWAKNIGALPVIENSRLVGLVTEFDLVRAFSEE